MTWLTGSPWPLAVTLFFLGAACGRFLNRGVERFPRHDRLGDQLRSVVTASATERRLRKAQRPWHRLPVIGWWLPAHPLAVSKGDRVRRSAVELANGLLFAALFAVEFPGGLRSDAPDPFAVPGLEFLAPDGGSLSLRLVRFIGHLVMVQALLIASVIDLETMTIPDGSTVPAMFVAFLLALTGGSHLVPVWYEDIGLTTLFGFGGDPQGGVQVPGWVTEHPHLHGLAVAAAGWVVGGGIVWAVRLIGHWALGREAMGFGDVVLMAMVGAFLGWQPTVVAFFLAPVCALAVVGVSLLTGSRREFPYGPWLSLAAVVVLLAWPTVWEAAGRFFLLGRMIPMLGLTILVLLAVLLRGMRLIRGADDWWEPQADWTSADQLLFASQEDQTPSRRSWPTAAGDHWPGTLSGRGRAGEDRWRRPVTAARWWPRSRP